LLGLVFKLLFRRDGVYADLQLHLPFVEFLVLIRFGIARFEIDQCDPRRIVLPQAMRVIIPPLGNEFNNMLKTTSLVSTISLYELLGAAEQIGNFQFRTLELLVTASIWYLAMTTVWGFIQAQIERRFNASTLDPALRDIPWWQRILGLRGRSAPAPALVGGAGVVGGVEPPTIQGDRR